MSVGAAVASSSRPVCSAVMASAISGRAANKHSRAIALGNGYVSHAKVITHRVADWGTPSASDHRPSVVSSLMDLLHAFRGRIEKFLVFLLLKRGRNKRRFFQLFT